MATDEHSQMHTMQCLEVWGGFGQTSSGVSMPGLDVFVFAQPYENAEAGGDLHYVSSCGTGRISRLLVADVSGHGTPVASIAETLRNLMRRHVNFIEQERFMAKLNDDFVPLTSLGTFATAVAATYFAPTNILKLTVAGHPPPLLYSAAKKSWRLAKDRTADQDASQSPSSAANASGDPATPSNLPLGILEDSHYPSQDYLANHGDLCVIYSDSLIEAPLVQRPSEGPHAEPHALARTAASANMNPMLGTEGLLAIIAKLDASSPQTLADQLYRAILRHADIQALRDDVTILVLSPTFQTKQASLTQRLGASCRFLWQVIRRVSGNRAVIIPWPERSIPNILGAIASPFEKYGSKTAERF